jgi:NhaA family Na+:H+ antiporter
MSQTQAKPATALGRLLQHEAAGGVVLMLAALVAILIANSPGKPWLDGVLEATLSITVNGTGLSKALVLWINDGLMAVFFFRVGLELKYELIEGRLRRLSDVILPGAAALGGMVMPALIYLGVALGFGQSGLTKGWAIPCATDIAFAMGVLALAGKGLPPTLKTFLLTLAILDDLGAILIIALFHGHELHPSWLVAALVPLAGLFALNAARVRRLGPSILLGIVLWVMVVGKPLGVMLAVTGLTAAGLARPPVGATASQMLGLGCLAGIGFTMSLFIGGLSFGEGAEMNAVRFGVLAGSALSAVLGFALLRRGTGQKAPDAL